MRLLAPQGGDFGRCHFGLLQQRTAIHRRLTYGWVPTSQQGDDGAAPDAITRLAASSGNSTFEQKLSVGGIKQDITGSFRPESVRFGAVSVGLNCHSWNGCGGPP